MTEAGPAGELSPQLDEFAAALREVAQRAQTLCATLKGEDLLRRPQPERWSVAEHVAHLSATSRSYLTLLDGAFADAEAKRLHGEGPFKADLVGRLLAWSLEPPARMRYRTKPPFEPVDIGSADAVLPTFLSLQDRLQESLRRANGLALDRVKIASPFDQRIRYNLVSAYAILLAHQRRHLWLAERVRDAQSGSAPRG